MDLSNSPTFIVLCGKTGSGKSMLLQQLEISGYPVINLEKIASHRGSAFGGLLLPPQPSQHEFENEIEKAVPNLSFAKYIFVEKKPSSIGKRKIPGWLYAKMNDGILVLLDVDKKIRINNILTEYKAAGKMKFMEALHKLKERLPSTVLYESEVDLHSENYEAFIDKMLDYYDQTAKYQSFSNPNIVVQIASLDPVIIMQQLMQLLKQSGILIS